MELRTATADDAGFIEHVFVLAADWNPANVKGEAHWRADPTFPKYVGGFPRGTDHGIVAEVRGAPVGAAWWRYFTEREPGYGFVAADIPELSIGVVLAQRGQGIGRALLRALVGVRAGPMSLSVEDGNPAIRLYESEGFVPVGRVGGSTTMLHPGRVVGTAVDDRP